MTLTRTRKRILTLSGLTSLRESYVIYVFIVIFTCGIYYHYNIHWHTMQGSSVHEMDIVLITFIYIYIYIYT